MTALSIKSPKLKAALDQVASLSGNPNFTKVEMKPGLGLGLSFHDTGAQTYSIRCFEGAVSDNLISSIHFSIPNDSESCSTIKAPKILLGKLFSKLIDLGEIKVKTKELREWVMQTFRAIAGAPAAWGELCTYMRKMFRDTVEAEAELKH